MGAHHYGLRRRPTKEGHDTILVAVNRLTKYARFVLLKHPFTTLQVIVKFIKEVVKLHGFPSSILFDRDKIFMSIFWRESFRLQHTTLKHSPAFHPYIDRQIVIVNKALETYLQCFANGQPQKSATWIHWIEFCDNTSPQKTTQMTPLQTLNGRIPPHIVRFGYKQTRVNIVEQISKKETPC